MSSQWVIQKATASKTFPKEKPVCTPSFGKLSVCGGSKFENRKTVRRSCELINYSSFFFFFFFKKPGPLEFFQAYIMFDFRKRGLLGRVTTKCPNVKQAVTVPPTESRRTRAKTKPLTWEKRSYRELQCIRPVSFRGHMVDIRWSLRKRNLRQWVTLKYHCNN